MVELALLVQKYLLTGTNVQILTREERPSRCIVNSRELALSLKWTASKLRCLSRLGVTGAEAATGGVGENGEREGKIRVRGGVHMVFTEQRSHSFLQLVVLMQSAAVVVAPHGTQVYNVVVARVGTVLIELCAYTSEFKTPLGHDVLMSNHMVARAVGMRTWVLGMEGVGWEPATSTRPFIVHPPKIISIILHESKVPVHQVATLGVTWRQRGARQVVGRWKSGHLNLVQHDFCQEKCPGCALGEDEVVRARSECLFLAVEKVGEEGGEGGEARFVVAHHAIQVAGLCSGHGEISIEINQSALSTGKHLLSLVLYATSSSSSRSRRYESNVSRWRRRMKREIQGDAGGDAPVRVGLQTQPEIINFN